MPPDRGRPIKVASAYLHRCTSNSSHVYAESDDFNVQSPLPQQPDCSFTDTMQRSYHCQPPDADSTMQRSNHCQPPDTGSYCNTMQCSNHCQPPDADSYCNTMEPEVRSIEDDDALILFDLAKVSFHLIQCPC